MSSGTQDVHERALTVYMRPGYAVWRQVLTQLPAPFPDLAQGMHIASSWTEFRNISQHQAIGQGSVDVDSWRQYVDTLAQGSHVQLAGILYTAERDMAEEAGAAWYRSEIIMRSHFLLLVQVQETSTSQQPLCGGWLPCQQAVASGGGIICLVCMYWTKLFLFQLMSVHLMRLQQV